MTITRKLRFGIKDQKLISWYNACKNSDMKNMSKIIALAIEYHELTGRYIEIAKIKLPEYTYNSISLCMSFANGSFIQKWYSKNHVGFQNAVRNVLNMSITILPNNCAENEVLVTYQQLEMFLNNIRTNYVLALNNNVDTIEVGYSMQIPAYPKTTAATLSSNSIIAKQNDLSNKSNTGHTENTESSLSDAVDAKKVDSIDDDFFDDFLNAIRDKNTKKR